MHSAPFYQHRSIVFFEKSQFEPEETEIISIYSLKPYYSPLKGTDALMLFLKYADSDCVTDLLQNNINSSFDILLTYLYSTLYDHIFVVLQIIDILFETANFETHYYAHKVINYLDFTINYLISNYEVENDFISSDTNEKIVQSISHIYSYSKNRNLSKIALQFLRKLLISGTNSAQMCALKIIEIGLSSCDQSFFDTNVTTALLDLLDNVTSDIGLILKVIRVRFQFFFFITPDLKK